MDSSLRNEDASITSAIFIHWMMFASVFVYGGIAYTVYTMLKDAPADDSLFRLMVIVMSVMSVLVFASVLFFRTYWLSPESFANLDESDQAEGQYVTAMIIQSGLIESIAIYGLVLSILFQSFWIYVPYAAISLSLFVVFRPSRQDFDRRLERAGMESPQEAPHDTEPRP